MFGIARRLLGTVPPTVESDHASRVSALELHVRVLNERLADLEREKVTRNAEHSAMVDQLDRLYKRISARIARGGEKETTHAATESVLSLRNRLGK